MHHSNLHIPDHTSRPATTIDRPQTKPTSPPSNQLIRSLGIVGLDALEPVILAALASETPLLLVGTHGTAKSLLLCRMCEGLGLVWRHYNASLVNYDDLIGYPLPDASGTLSFVQTPASVWNAQAVFIDEISRARPDMLNRLFPIIHERKVQGLALPSLRYRWAAMNPPADPEAVTSETYLGSEPLDPALADRFGFVIEVPSLDQLSDDDQRFVISNEMKPVSPTTAAVLTATVHQIVNEIRLIKPSLRSVVTEYIRSILHHATQLQLVLSGRRAAMIFQNILAVHAARTVRQPDADLGDSAWLALKNSLPQRGQRVTIDMSRLLISHQEVWKSLQWEATDPRRILACERDPIRRLLRAAAFPQIAMQDLSAYAADALASVTVGARHALALYCMESGLASRVIAPIAEQIAKLFQLVSQSQGVNASVATSSPKHLAWQEVVHQLSLIPADNLDEPLIRNLLSGLFAAGDIATKDDVVAVMTSWQDVRTLCEREPHASAA